MYISVNFDDLHLPPDNTVQLRKRVKLFSGSLNIFTTIFFLTATKPPQVSLSELCMNLRTSSSEVTPGRNFCKIIRTDLWHLVKWHVTRCIISQTRTNVV